MRCQRRRIIPEVNMDPGPCPGRASISYRNMFSYHMFTLRTHCLRRLVLLLLLRRTLRLHYIREFAYARHACSPMYNGGFARMRSRNSGAHACAYSCSSFLLATFTSFSWLLKEGIRDKHTDSVTGQGIPACMARVDRWHFLACFL